MFREKCPGFYSPSSGRVKKSFSRGVANNVIALFFVAAINDLLPEFDDLLASARSCPDIRVIITLYFTSVSRGLIVRPFSAMPTSVTFVHQSPRSPRSPRSARASGAVASLPPHRGVVPPPAYTPSPLRKNFARSPEDPNASTAALLGSGAQSSSRLDLDAQPGLAAPPQFVIGGGEDNEDSDVGSEDSASETDLDPEIVTNSAFAMKALAKWKEGEDPFSDAYAPPPPSPSTKPALRKRSPPSISTVVVDLDVGTQLPYAAEVEVSPSPPIELKPGRPEYNHILQEIIEREQAYTRTHHSHFEEKFAALNGAEGVPNAALAGAGRIAVAACGPAGMVSSLRSMCFDADGVEFHAE